MPVLVLTARAGEADIVLGFKLGAYDYLTKPLNFEELKITIERAMNHLQLSIENARLKKKISDRKL